MSSIKPIPMDASMLIINFMRLTSSLQRCLDQHESRSKSPALFNNMVERPCYRPAFCPRAELWLGSLPSLCATVPLHPNVYEPKPPVIALRISFLNLSWGDGGRVIVPGTGRDLICLLTMKVFLRWRNLGVRHRCNYNWSQPFTQWRVIDLFMIN